MSTAGQYHLLLLQAPFLQGLQQGSTNCCCFRNLSFLVYSRAGPTAAASGTFPSRSTAGQNQLLLLQEPFLQGLQQGRTNCCCFRNLSFKVYSRAVPSAAASGTFPSRSTPGQYQLLLLQAPFLQGLHQGSTNCCCFRHLSFKVYSRAVPTAAASGTFPSRSTPGQYQLLLLQAPFLQGLHQGSTNCCCFRHLSFKVYTRAVPTAAASGTFPSRSTPGQYQLLLLQAPFLQGLHQGSTNCCCFRHLSFKVYTRAVPTAAASGTFPSRSTPGQYQLLLLQAPFLQGLHQGSTNCCCFRHLSFKVYTRAVPTAAASGTFPSRSTAGQYQLLLLQAPFLQGLQQGSTNCCCFRHLSFKVYSRAVPTAAASGTFPSRSTAGQYQLLLLQAPFLQGLQQGSTNCCCFRHLSFKVYSRAGSTAAASGTSPLPVYSRAGSTAAASGTSPLPVYSRAGPTAAASGTSPLPVYSRAGSTAAASGTSPLPVYSRAGSTAAASGTSPLPVYSRAGPTAAASGTSPLPVYSRAGPTAAASGTSPLPVYSRAGPTAAASGTSPLPVYSRAGLFYDMDIINNINTQTDVTAGSMEGSCHIQSVEFRLSPDVPTMTCPPLVQCSGILGEDGFTPAPHLRFEFSVFCRQEMEIRHSMSAGERLLLSVAEQCFVFVLFFKPIQSPACPTLCPVKKKNKKKHCFAAESRRRSWADPLQTHLKEWV
ncbi:uncharacterized protein RB166_001348 [Leptodactylus fuscus]|uniref:uncharacterized protein LOC142195768 n=1 Tax=Leptodactylus fuscus TaxID=238119 RepID=UPI003F4EBEEF